MAKMISYTDSTDILNDASCKVCVYLPVCYGNCPEYIASGFNKCTPLKHYSQKLIPLFMRYKGYSPETNKAANTQQELK